LDQRRSTVDRGLAAQQQQQQQQEFVILIDAVAAGPAKKPWNKQLVSVEGCARMGWV